MENSKHTVNIKKPELSCLIAEAIEEIMVGGGRGVRKDDEVVYQPVHMWNGRVVLRHDSKERITDGVIDGRGKPKNMYTSNTDFTNYFWASEKRGFDNSNFSSYAYYCIVDPDEIYDMDGNPKGYGSMMDAVDNERFVSARWNDGAIAVVSEEPTRIDFIKSKDGVYDRKWNLLRSGIKYGNIEKNRGIAEKLKKFRNVDVPEFLGGYGYEDMLS